MGHSYFSCGCWIGRSAKGEIVAVGLCERHRLPKEEILNIGIEKIAERLIKERIDNENRWFWL